MIAGQLLIAGLYQEIPDPYGPQPEYLYQVTGAARGRVIAETYREFTVEANCWDTAWEETGRQARRWLEIFGVRIPLGFWSPPSGETRNHSQTSRAKLLGVELPLAVENQVVVHLKERRRELSEDQQKTAALLKLREAQKAVLPQGAKVVNERLSFQFCEGRCILSAQCRCREDIGEVKTISIN